MADDKGPPESVELPIRWVIPKDMRSTFANQLAVQFDQHEYHLLFFESSPPLLFPNDPNVGEALKNLKDITATCVAHLVISKERMPAFVATLMRNLGRQEALKQELDVVKDAG